MGDSLVISLQDKKYTTSPTCLNFRLKVSRSLALEQDCRYSDLLWRTSVKPIVLCNIWIIPPNELPEMLSIQATGNLSMYRFSPENRSYARFRRPPGAMRTNHGANDRASANVLCVPENAFSDPFQFHVVHQSRITL